MHLKRWLTGIIALPILIYIIGPYSPRWVLYSILFAATIISLMEFYKITASDLPRPVKFSIYFLTLLLFLVIYQRQILFVQLVIALFAFVPMSYFMFTRSSPGQQSTTDIGKAVIGPIYIAIPLSMIIYIDCHDPDKGYLWIFFLLVVIFASDTGAFYCGKLFGKHKLYEAVSPGKTWEGAIGGGVFSVIVALCFLFFVPHFQISPGMLVLVIVLTVVGQIGDLVESMLKRNHGIKDSGRILPGHGGILDRIDGLLFAIPVLFVYLNFVTV
jgi:phosphatidate cytidylyltransferase